MHFFTRLHHFFFSIFSPHSSFHICNRLIYQLPFWSQPAQKLLDSYPIFPTEPSLIYQFAHNLYWEGKMVCSDLIHSCLKKPFTIFYPLMCFNSSFFTSSFFLFPNMFQFVLPQELLFSSVLTNSLISQSFSFLSLQTSWKCRELVNFTSSSSAHNSNPWNLVYIWFISHLYNYFLFLTACFLSCPGILLCFICSFISEIKLNNIWG